MATITVSIPKVLDVKDEVEELVTDLEPMISKPVYMQMIPKIVHEVE